MDPTVVVMDDGLPESAPDRPERRVRAVMVPCHAVLEAFLIGMWAELPAVVRYPVLPGLPADIRIEGPPHVDVLRRCFVFLVSHPSFEPVPDGEIAPPLAGGPLGLEYRAVEVKHPE